MQVTLIFPFPLNVSLQAGDDLYATHTDDNQAGQNHANVGSLHPRKVAEVVSVDHDTQTVVVETWGPYDWWLPITGDKYFFFGKDKRANTSGILGYFAEAEYRNYTKRQAEMFATAVDYVESSK